MAALVCDLCGGKLLGRPGNVFQCDSCGTEYSKEWAKEKVQEIQGSVKVEGTVQVEGSVKVEGMANVQSMVKRAFLLLESHEFDKADALLDEVLKANPECSDAYLGKVMAEREIDSRDNLPLSLEDYTAEAQDGSFKLWLRYCGSDERSRLLYDCGMKWISEKQYYLALHWLEASGFPEAEEQMLLCQELYAETRKDLPHKRLLAEQLQHFLSTDGDHVVGLKSDGSVVAAGTNKDGECDVQHWRDIIAISCGYNFTVGLKSDGSVVATGCKSMGQCDVQSWRNIVSIFAGTFHTVGLKSDGSVIATGKNDEGQCNVQRWHDIVKIAVFQDRTLGLQSDGAVVATGTNPHGQCNVEGWRDIVAIFSLDYLTYGLKSDGSVIATGFNENGECDVEHWRNIVAIYQGFALSGLGLKSDGSIAIQKDECMECHIPVSNDIIAVSSFNWAPVCLRANGTVVAPFEDSDTNELKNWSNIVALFSGHILNDECLIGLKSDGTVIFAGMLPSEMESKFGHWKLFDNPEQAIQAVETRKAEPIERRRREAAKKKLLLTAETVALKAELTALKGLFSEIRRNRIEARLAQINADESMH